MPPPGQTRSSFEVIMVSPLRGRVYLIPCCRRDAQCPKKKLSLPFERPLNECLVIFVVRFIGSNFDVDIPGTRCFDRDQIINIHQHIFFLHSFTMGPSSVTDGTRL